MLIFVHVSNLDLHVISMFFS